MEIWSYEQIPISKSLNKPDLKCFLTYKKTKYNIYLGCAGGWVYNSLTKKCYKDFDEALTWDAARASCQAQINGDLASVPDEATNEFLKDKFTQGWIGGHLDSNGDWAWSDGTPWGYTSWSSGNPSRTDGTGAIRLKNVGWDDLNPEFLRKYICQHQSVKTVAGKHLKINFEKNKDNHHLETFL